MENRSQNYIKGAAILAATVAVTKVIGAIYKIPLYNLLGDEGTAHFQVTYTIYNLLLTVATAGVPVALSRLISSAHSVGRDRQSSRIFKAAMPTFILIGIICGGAMFIWAQKIANLIGDHEIADGIRCLAPAVFFYCMIAVYRGYSQGHGDMIPTAISQILEVLCKLFFGLVIAWLLLKRGYGTPTVSAGAFAGITAGLLLSVPAMAYYKRQAEKKNAYHLDGRDPYVLSYRDTLAEIFRISIPITLGAVVLNIISLIDTKLVLLRLQTGAGYDYMTAKVLYGAYSKALTLFNMPAAFIVPVTVSVVPAIAAALARKENDSARAVMTSAMKITNLIGLPAGAGLLILSVPIYNGLYWGSNENGPALLALLGIASYFVCIQLITTSILQANGHERVSMLSLPLGGIVKFVAVWFLVGNPAVGIYGSPLSTIICYVCISVFNIWFIMRKQTVRPEMLKAFLRPFICTVIMAAAAFAAYWLGMRTLGGWFSASRPHMLVIMCISVAVAVLVYAVMIIVLGGVTREDLRLLPKGDKIADFLKIK